MPKGYRRRVLAIASSDFWYMVPRWGQGIKYKAHGPIQSTKDVLDPNREAETNTQGYA